MSYKTLEVELENGMVIPKGFDTGTVPLQGRALLTLLDKQELEGMDSQERHPLSERVKGTGGTGSGNFVDLSSNPKHLEDLGT